VWSCSVGGVSHKLPIDSQRVSFRKNEKSCSFRVEFDLNRLDFDLFDMDDSFDR